MKILEMINAGIFSIGVTKEFLGKYWKTIFTNINVREALVLKENSVIAWAIRKNSPQVKAEIDDLFGLIIAACEIVGQETVKYVNNIYKYYFAYTLIKLHQERYPKDVTKP